MLAALRLALLSVLLGVGAIPSSIAATLYALELLWANDPDYSEATNQGNRLWRIDTSTATVTKVVNVRGPLNGMGGIDFDEDGALFWFGTEVFSPSNTHPAVCLYRIDMASGAAARIACPFVFGGSKTADSFAIVGRKGYTVMHEVRGQEGFAQLYEINLNSGSATAIGPGYSIPGASPPATLPAGFKTLGLATDGAQLFAIRYNGEIHRLDLDTGQIVATIRNGSFPGPVANGPNLAFADDVLWVAADNKKIFKIDPSSGADTMIVDNPITRGWWLIGGLAASDRPNFTSIAASSLNVDATRVGRTASGDLFPRAASVLASAPVRLGDAQVIRSLRCVAGDNLAQGAVTASVKRTAISTGSAGNETVVSVSTAGAAQSASPVELRSTPSTALARVDNRRYGYHLQVDFAGGQSGAQPANPRLYFRGCVIETR